MVMSISTTTRPWLTLVVDFHSNSPVTACIRLKRATASWRHYSIKLSLAQFDSKAGDAGHGIAHSGSRAGCHPASRERHMAPDAGDYRGYTRPCRVVARVIAP